MQQADDLRQRGRVKYWIPDRGFGFIQRPGGLTDVFVHISHVAHYQHLAAGDHVSFDVMQTQRGEQAIDVEIVN